MKILQTLRNNPRIYRLCQSVLIIYSVTCVGVIIYKQSFPASRALDANARDFFNRYRPPAIRDAAFHPGLLTHQVIAMDERNGIINKAVAGDAMANVNHYISSVQIHCRLNAGAPAFLNCANDVLHDNFYYRSADDAGRGYAAHNSDCDANVYLMADAARLAGLATYIVYAPGHAFIAWKDSDGEFRYHETTGGNNRGRPFNFSDPLYKKTLDSTYYTPVATDSPLVMANYRAITTGVTGNGEELPELVKQYPHDSLIRDARLRWQRQHEGITASDAGYIRNALTTTTDGADLNLSLTDYYLRAGDNVRARETFNRISSRDCGTECYAYGVRLGITKFRVMNTVWKYYAQFTGDHGTSANTWTFWGIWPKSIFLLVVLAFIIPWVVNAKSSGERS